MSRPRMVVQCAVFMTSRNAYSAWLMTSAMCRRRFEDDGETGDLCRVDVSVADMLVNRLVNVSFNSLRRVTQCCLLFAMSGGFC